MRMKHLQKAKQFQNWNEDDLAHNCFTDGSTIKIMKDSYQFVRRKPLEVFSPYCLKHPAKVMVRSMISFKGLGRLYIAKFNMNQQLDVMQTRMQPQLKQGFPEGNCIGMQGRYPCHTAGRAMSYFEEISPEILSFPKKQI